MTDEEQKELEEDAVLLRVQALLEIQAQVNAMTTRYILGVLNGGQAERAKGLDRAALERIRSEIYGIQV
jgi:hypothetical protein